MKKLILFLMLCVIAWSNAVAQEFTIDELKYSINDDGTTVNVVGPVDKNVSSVTIPEKVSYNDNEYAVTIIAPLAFSNCKNLTSIVIPNTVKNIEEYAFRDCSGLTSVTLSNSLKTIGNYAFYGCTCLTSLTLPNSVNSLGVGFLIGTNVTSINIPSSLTSIGEDTFRESKLATITIPNTVTTIGDYAFYDCKNLKTIVMPTSMNSIGAKAFMNCKSLKSITIPDGITRIEEHTFDNCQNIEAVIIPNSVEYIGDGAFGWCEKLGSIDIPNSVTQIGLRAFGDCDAFDTINIPNSVKSIGTSAFVSCDNLTTVIIGNSVENIGNAPFYGNPKLNHVEVKFTTIGDGINEDWLTRTSATGVFEGPCELLDNYIEKLHLPADWTAKANHNLQLTPAVVETCTTVGNNAYYTCQNCYKFFSDAEGENEIAENSWVRPALGHDWEDIYDEPNYTWTHHCKNDAAHDMHRKQLCFEARLDNSNIRWSQNSENKFLQYSINWSDEWTELTNVGVTLNKGDKVWIKGSTPEAYSHGRFNIYNGSFDASGSIMSLLDGEGTSTVIPYEDCFKQMFTYCDDLYKAPALPATTLTSGCYAEMFSYCKDLKSAPALPATTLATGSYKEMFRGCNNLSNVPALPAETLVENCYYYMFQGCQKLESLTINATDVSATNCLKWCLDGTSLYSSKPVLHITDELALQNVDLGLPTKWRVDKVGIHANQDPDNAGDYYATYYDSQSEYSVKEGTKAYTGIVDGSVLNMTAEADNIIPAGEGVLLKGNTADVILTLSDTEKEQTPGNALTGSDTNTTAPANSYIFTYAQNGLGFYKYAAGKPLTAHKAYLVYEKPNDAKGFRMVFDRMDGGVTGIENLTPALFKGEGAYYNLSGLRFSRMQKGINIVNGKKMVIK